MNNIIILSIAVLFFFLCYLVFIMKNPSRIVSLIVIALPLSPYFVASWFEYSSYGLMITFTDVLVVFLFVLLFLRVCIRNRLKLDYPLMKLNLGLLVLYSCIMLVQSIGWDLKQIIFQILYISRYFMYLMIGFYVWQYLPVDREKIEKYILILIAALHLNSVYAIGRSVHYVLTGNVPRVSGFWGAIVNDPFIFKGMTPDIVDTGAFGMYLCISLILTIGYIVYTEPKPAGWKMKFATSALCFGMLAIFMTLSRASIFAFLGSSFYMIVLKGKLLSRRKMRIGIIISTFFVLAFTMAASLNINISTIITKRLTVDTFNALNFETSRYIGTYEIFMYTIDNFQHWWGHGISSWRLFMEQFHEQGITRHGSKGMYNGYLAILWDAGIFGVILWTFWFRKHFVIFSRIAREMPEVKWLAISLETVLISFLIVMLSFEYVNNYRLMGYLSLLVGLLLKYREESGYSKDAALITQQ